MGSSEKFCLRWNDFESNISVAFREIREEKDFFDVTLSVGDRQIQAHKLILSACSPFFRSVLRQNPHAHPLLFLKGVAFTDLTAVLNFMYHGEVNVAQEELNSFLAVAEDLKVKGLTQSNSSKEPPPTPAPAPRPLPTQRPRSPPRHLPAPPPQKRPRPTPTYDDDIQEVQPVVKQEPLPAEPAVEPPHPYSQEVQGGQELAHMEEGGNYEEENYDYGGYEDEENYAMAETGGEQNKGLATSIGPDQAELYMKEEDGVYCCLLCSKQFPQNKSNCKRHVLLVHSEASHANCPHCGKTYRTEQSMKSHMRQTHGVYSK